MSLNEAALRDSIIGNQDVLYWSIAEAQFEQKEAQLLLEKNHRFVDYCKRISIHERMVGTI